MISEDNMWLLQAGPFLYIILFWRISVWLKRHERYISDFYWALKEKYPRSYIKQNKVIRFIRKFLGMNTKERIHWMFCFYHYLQIIMLITPIFLLVICWFIPLEITVMIFGWFGIGPNVFVAVIDTWFMMIQCFRCERIRKRDPKHKRCQFQSEKTWNWRI